MFHPTNPSFLLRISGMLLALMLLVSACTAPAQPLAVAPSPTAPAKPAETAAPPAQPAPTLAPAGSSFAINGSTSVTVIGNGVAQEITSQAIPAVQAGDNVSELQVMPQYTLLTLQGYPVTNNRRSPQIFIYPVKDLVVNQGAAKQAADLQSLLQSQQVGDQIPYLPLAFSVRQAILSQVKFLDFKNGKGVRFLTEWHNGLAPMDNQNLLYTYQSLTSDGKYYIAAVLPVNLPVLPADANDTSKFPADFQASYTQYLADTVSLLNQQPLSAFTPDLSKLDAMVQSMEVK